MCGKVRVKRCESTKMDKFIIKKCLKKGLKNPCSIALILNRPCSETMYLIKNSEEGIYNPPKASPKIPQKTYFSDKNEYTEILINVVGLQCACKDGCSVENDCPCLLGETNEKDEIINRKCCEKFCSCRTDCEYRFLGCNCQYGKCNTKSCVCFANSRECDPDLCRSCCSAQAVKEKSSLTMHSRSSTLVLCQNVKVQVKYKKRTALSPSLIEGAGTGLILLEGASKDDFIIEYTGELINENETNRRASVYDYRQHSYIFSMYPDPSSSIDATYLGNKMRFVNHKSHDEENCYTKV